MESRLSQILITGGTGLVGRRLSEHLEENVVVTSRNAEAAQKSLVNPQVEAIQWDYQSARPNLSSLRLKAIVNLMGESVAKGRWTPEKKSRMHESRIRSTQLLIESVAALEPKPEVLVSASAVGFYADGGEQEITETGEMGTGYLADLAHAWEDAATQIESLGVRLVILRIGVVLSTDGGALAEMLPIFKSGFGGRLGSGKQYFPWVHIDDLVRLICWAIENDEVSGVYNATSPCPVTNSEFTKVLARAIRRPAFLPVPKFALKLTFGEFAESLYASQRVVPANAIQQGFEFRYPTLESALAHLLK